MEINFLAVVLAAVAGIAIGSIWFGPKTFFPIWWKYLGKTSSQPAANSNMVAVFSATILAAVVQAFVLSVVISISNQALGPIGVFGGVATGALMGLGFASASSISHHLFGGFSFRAWALEVGQDIVSLSAMGAIIALLA